MINLRSNPLPILDIDKLYLAEYQHFDGDEFVTFNIFDIYPDSMRIVLAVTDRGRIRTITYDLLVDSNGKLYIEYGCEYTKIYIDDFAEV